jgi:hypothetical protein
MKGARSITLLPLMMGAACEDLVDLRSAIQLLRR